MLDMHTIELTPADLGITLDTSDTEISIIAGMLLAEAAEAIGCPVSAIDGILPRLVAQLEAMRDEA